MKSGPPLRQGALGVNIASNQSMRIFPSISARNIIKQDGNAIHIYYRDVCLKVCGYVTCFHFSLGERSV